MQPQPGNPSGAQSPLQHRLIELEEANSQLAQRNHQLTELLHTDPLTGLLNRRGLTPRLAAEQGLLQRGSHTCSAILIDLDDFKCINDTLGYNAGDRALQAVARAMTETLRTSDHAARIGGDEFLVLLPDTALRAAMIVAERLRQAIGAPANHPLTASMGVLELATTHRSIAAILKPIHGALSASKSHGKDRITAATPNRSEDDPRFTPLYDLSDGHIIAERCSVPLVGGLDGALLTIDACRRRPGALPLDIPLRPRVLLQPDLLARLPARRVWGAALAPSSLIDEVLALRGAVERLRAQGIRLHLTGITGNRRELEAMVLLRPEVITLHSRLLGSRTPGSLERMCAVARSLGAEILAEGIDSEEARQAAAAAGIIGGTGSVLRERAT